MKKESEQSKLRAQDIARFNRNCFDRLGDDIGQEIIDKLEARIDPRSMLRKDKGGRIDPLQMAARCGAFEAVSFLKQCIDFGSRNE